MTARSADSRRRIGTWQLAVPSSVNANQPVPGVVLIRERAVAGHVAGRVVGRRGNAVVEVISLAAFTSRVCVVPVVATLEMLPRPSRPHD